MSSVQWRARIARPLWILQLLSVLMAITWLIAVVPKRFDLTFPEGALVARALDVADGVNPYTDWRAWPHHFAPYGPLTYAVPGWLLRLTPEQDRVWKGYLAGRLLSLGSILLILLLTGWAAQRIGVGWWWAVPALALTLRWQLMWQYCTSYRPDAPRTMLCILALTLVLGRPFSVGRMVTALGLIWISFWFKPVGLAALAGVLVWVGLHRGWRIALYAALIFMATGLALFASLDWLWDGRLRLNMIDSLRNGFDTTWIRTLYFAQWRYPVDFVMLVASSIGGAALWKARLNPRLHPMLPVIVAMPVSYGLGLAQALKAGADINYFLEPMAIAGIVLAWALAHVWRAGIVNPSGNRLSRLREACWWLIVIPWLLYDIWAQADFLPLQLHTIRPRYSEYPITQIVRASTGPILSQTPYLTLQAHDIRAPLDWFHYRNLVQQGFLDPHPLQERIMRRELSLIILHESNAPQGTIPPQWQDLFGPGFSDALAANYDQGQRQMNAVFFVPKQQP